MDVIGLVRLEADELQFGSGATLSSVFFLLLKPRFCSEWYDYKLAMGCMSYDSQVNFRLQNSTRDPTKPG